MYKRVLFLVVILLSVMVILGCSQENSADNNKYLQILLVEKKYEKIENILKKVLLGREKDKDGRSVIHDRFIELTMSSSYEAKDLDKCINRLLEWVKKYPNSHFANASLGQAYIEYAWNARTNAVYSAIGKERAELFEKRIRLAKDYLMKAYELDPTDPVVPIEMITVSKVHPDSYQDSEEMEGWYRKAIAIDPGDLLAYRSKLNFLQPRWGGSFKKELVFARQVLHSAPKDSMAPWILIKAHWHIYEANIKKNYFKRPAVWSEMKDTFIELEKRFPASNKLQNWFARTAYLAGDYNTARTEFSKIGRNWHQEVWKDQQDFENNRNIILATSASDIAAQAQPSNDLKTLLHQGHYQEIEQALYSQLKKKELDSEGRRVIHAKIYEISVPDERDASAMQNNIGLLENWVKTRPDSHFANTALGTAYIYYAWKARGEGWASSVTTDGWRLFRERIELAAQYLEKAYALDATDPDAPYHMITVAAVRANRTQSEFEKWFKRGIEADPVDYSLYEKKHQYLDPKWGGSYQMQLAFSREIRRTAPSTSMAPYLLTCTHWEIFKTNEDSGYFTRESIWKEMKEAYTELTTRFPESTLIRNWFARTACLAGDYETANTQFAQIGNSWSKEVWKDKYKFEFYKQFALIGETP